MCVVEEFDPVLRQRFTGAIKDCRGFTTRLFIKRILGRYPRAAHVFETEYLGVASYVLNVIATLFIRKVSTDRFEASCVELLFKFIRWQTICSCQLDILDFEVAYLVKSTRYVFLELISQTV